MRFLAFLNLVIIFNSTQMLSAQSARTDKYLADMLSRNKDSVFSKVLKDPGKYRLQIIYTKIDRDKKNNPSFTDYYFNYDQEMYFNPASMVKMPLAFLSLEKLNEMKQSGIDKQTI